MSAPGHDAGAELHARPVSGGSGPTFADVNRDVIRTLEFPSSLYFGWMSFIALTLAGGIVAWVFQIYYGMGMAFGLTFPNGPDAGGRIAIDYGVYGIPETFIMGRDGRIFYKHIGLIGRPRSTRASRRRSGEPCHPAKGGVDSISGCSECRGGPRARRAG